MEKYVKPPRKNHRKSQESYLLCAGAMAKNNDDNRWNAPKGGITTIYHIIIFFEIPLDTFQKNLDNSFYLGKIKYLDNI